MIELPDNIDCRKLAGHHQDQSECLNHRCSSLTYLAFARTATPCNVLTKPPKLFTRNKNKKNKQFQINSYE